MHSLWCLVIVFDRILALLFLHLKSIIIIVHQALTSVTQLTFLSAKERGGSSIYT